MNGIQEVLAFWFDAATRPHWQEPSPAFDQTVRKRFAELFARAATGELRDWETSGEGCLALCILLNQMPHCMFRGDRRMFATDDKALAVADLAVSKGFDRELTGEQRRFLYQPFLDSEHLANVLRALALFEVARLNDEARRAQHGVDVIRRFGRFPERNAILGRPSTPEEVAYLQEHATATSSQAVGSGRYQRTGSAARSDG